MIRNKRGMMTHFLIGIAIVLYSSVISAATSATPSTIHLNSGEMGFLPFLEMVSEKLDLQIDASGLGDETDKQPVTVPEMGQLDVERAKAVVLNVLYLEGYTWIHHPLTDLYRVTRLREARDHELPFITDSKDLPKNDLLVTLLLPLQHASPDDIARTARSFMPANSRIIPEDATHSVLITDSARNIAKLQRLVQRLDTPLAAKQVKEWQALRQAEASKPCPGGATKTQTPSPTILIALFSLIALVIGFLSRGYVIRRIEGGL